MTGDFNNGPNSPVYAHITGDILSDTGAPLFRSAYDIYRHLSEGISLKEDRHGPDLEAPFTSVNFKRQWTMDYLFYTHSRLRVTHLLQEFPSARGPARGGRTARMGGEGERKTEEGV